MKKSRTAVILCGGKGTRLGSIGKKTPKTLIKIQGKEILWYILKTLKKNKFNHVILPVGFKGNKIKNFIKKNKDLIPRVDLINTGIETNIGKRISMIRNSIISSNFLLLNGDAIFDFDLNKMFIKHQKQKKDITFISSEITYPYGTVGVRNNKVIDFKRNLVYEALRVRNKNDYIAYNYTGMSIISKKKILMQNKKYANSKNFEMDFFPFFIKRYESSLVKLSGFWHSVDNLKDISAINNKNSSKRKYLLLKKLKKKLIKNDKKKFLEK